MMVKKARNRLEITIKPIGIIHSPYKTKEECPIQSALCTDVQGTIEIFPEYAAALTDIDLFSHIYLLFQFDRAGEVKLVRPTFLDDEPHGIFASRHPCRPGGIGLSIVRLLQRKGNILTIGGVDVLDETPLIDIKPYIPRFDCFPEASEGWLRGKENRQKPPERE